LFVVEEEKKDELAKKKANKTILSKELFWNIVNRFLTFSTFLQVYNFVHGA
jgi:hypothetical protein